MLLNGVQKRQFCPFCAGWIRGYESQINADPDPNHWLHLYTMAPLLLDKNKNKNKNKNVYFPSPVIHTIIDLTVTFSYKPQSARRLRTNK